MIRYLTLIDETKKEKLQNEVWCLNKKPPEVPYLKIKIKVIGEEKKYALERPKKRRWFRLGV